MFKTFGNFGISLMNTCVFIFIKELTLFETPTEVTGGAVIFEQSNNYYILFTSEVTDKLLINHKDPVQLDFTRGGLSIYKRKDGNRIVRKDGPDRVIWLTDQSHIKIFEDYLDRWIDKFTSEGHVVFRKPVPTAKRLVNVKYKPRLKKKVDRLQSETKPVEPSGKKRVTRPEPQSAPEPVKPTGKKAVQRLTIPQAPVIIRTRLKKSNHNGKYQPVIMIRIHQQVCEMLNMTRGDRVKVVWNQNQITLIRSDDFGYSLYAPYWNPNRDYNNLMVELVAPISIPENWASLPTAPVENLRLSSRYIKFTIPQILIDKMDTLPDREFGVHKPSKRTQQQPETA